MMFSEFKKVMDAGIETNNFRDVLNDNIINKLTKKNQIMSKKFLVALYGFDLSDPAFVAFKYL